MARYLISYSTSFPLASSLRAVACLLFGTLQDPGVVGKSCDRIGGLNIHRTMYRRRYTK